MQRLFFILIIIFSLLPYSSKAHKRASWNVIVDTDGAADDFRMLNLIISSPDINLNAIITSDGILAPKQAASKIKGMLNEFNHQGVPVAAGFSRNMEVKHRNFANSLQWPGQASNNYTTNYQQLIIESLNMHKRKNVIIAAGPLTNIAKLLKNHPEYIQKIDRIIWYHNPLNPGFNYKHDSISAKQVIKAFPNIEFINTGDKQAKLDQDFFTFLTSLNNIYAKSLNAFCQQDKVKQHNFLGQYPIWDECLPLYLLHPTHFESDNNNNYLKSDNINLSLIGMLQSDKPQQGIVWQKNATGESYLREDVYTISNSIINKYGYNEFQVIAMTSEFHGHLGIYSIMGAKMGLRAMQYFCIGIDEMEVYSWAGTKPPISCMHDGIQFSTGSSLGYGTIYVVKDSVYRPKAIFNYKGRIIEISLKQEYQNLFKSDIKNSIKTYGLLSDEYWDEVRRLGLKYWLELDKLDIFEIKELSKIPNNINH